MRTADPKPPAREFVFTPARRAHLERVRPKAATAAAEWRRLHARRMSEQRSEDSLHWCRMNPEKAREKARLMTAARSARLQARKAKIDFRAAWALWNAGASWPQIARRLGEPATTLRRWAHEWRLGR